MNKNQSKVVDLLISSYALTDKEFKLIDLGCGAGCYEYVAVEDIEDQLNELLGGDK